MPAAKGRNTSESSADLEQPTGGIGFLPLANQPQLTQIRRLFARHARELADGLVKGAVRARAQKVGEFAAWTKTDRDVAEFVMGGACPT